MLHQIWHVTAFICSWPVWLKWNGICQPAGCVNILPHPPAAAQDQTFHGKPGLNSIGYALELGRFNADMWRWGLSKSPACDCGADQQTTNHIITECLLYRPPKWSAWLYWCWCRCRCSNSWMATKQVPRDLTVSFGYKVSHARRLKWIFIST